MQTTWQRTSNRSVLSTLPDDIYYPIKFNEMSNMRSALARHSLHSYIAILFLQHTIYTFEYAELPLCSYIVNNICDILLFLFRKESLPVKRFGTSLPKSRGYDTRQGTN